MENSNHRSSISEFWKSCNERVREIAREYSIDKVLYGSGYPVSTPNIVVMYKDAITGEGMGYNVFVYPNGNNGYKDEYKYFSIDDNSLNNNKLN